MSLETVAETGGRAGASRDEKVELLFGSDQAGIRSEDIRRTNHVRCLEDKVREAWRRWFGQCTGEDGECMIRGMLRLELEGLEEEQRGDL